MSIQYLISTGTYVVKWTKLMYIFIAKIKLRSYFKLLPIILVKMFTRYT